MTERQELFFRALLQPFPPQAYHKVRGFTYVKARTIMARMDDIVGPQGWVAETTTTDRGCKCRLKILCPDEGPDGWAWHYKEDVGGHEDMGFTNKQTGEWEPDQDADEKAASTNAFRRAAAQWGFGRELYQEGVPRWLGDLYPQSMVVTPREEPILAPDTVSQDQRQPVPAPSPAALDPVERRPQPPQDGQRQIRLDPPVKARAVYPWLMNLQKRFGISIIDGVNDFCNENFGSWDTRLLGDQQVILLTTWVIEQVKQWHNYDGCFDLKDPTANRQAPQTTGHAIAEVADLLNDKTRTHRGNLKRAIVAIGTIFVRKLTGREPYPLEINTFIAENAAAAANKSGVTGEVLKSLKDCADEIWLNNILIQCQRELDRAAATQRAGSVPSLATAIAASDDEDDISF